MGRSQKIVLGIDIGGWKIRAEGEKFSTPRTKKEFVALLKKFSEAKRIEIGVAGVISGTRVVFSPNIPYLKNFDFREIFPKSTLLVDNDARAFLKRKLKKIRAKKVLAFTIGTGIGRAYAERGRVMRIKKFEYPEKWEKEYQKIRDKRDYEKLAKFLGEKLSILIKKYKPQAVVLGGGVLKKRGFYKKLCKRLKVKTYV